MNLRWNVEGGETEKGLVAGPCAALAVDCSHRTELDIAEAHAVEIIETGFEMRIPQHRDDKHAPRGHDILDGGVLLLRDRFLPERTFREIAAGFKHAPAGCVLVAANHQVFAREARAVPGYSVPCDPLPPHIDQKIPEIHRGRTRRAVVDERQQPASARIDSEAQHLVHTEIAPEEFDIGHRAVLQAMLVQSRSLLPVPHIVHAPAIGTQPHAEIASGRQHFREIPLLVHVHETDMRFVHPAVAHGVGDQRAVLRHIDQQDAGTLIDAQSMRIDQHDFRPMQSVTHAQY